MDRDGFARILEWLEPLELRSVIAEIAEDLYSFPDWKIRVSAIRFIEVVDYHKK